MSKRYTHTEIRQAFEEWQNTSTEQLSRRQHFWDRYVDHREHLVEGTTERRRLEGQGSLAEVTENENEEVA